MIQKARLNLVYVFYYTAIIFPIELMTKNARKHWSIHAQFQKFIISFKTTLIFSFCILFNSFSHTLFFWIIGILNLFSLLLFLWIIGILNLFLSCCFSGSLAYSIFFLSCCFSGSMAYSTFFLSHRITFSSFILFF